MQWSLTGYKFTWEIPSYFDNMLKKSFFFPSLDSVYCDLHSHILTTSTIHCTVRISLLKVFPYVSEEGEINSATSSKNNSRCSSTAENPLLKKRFSLDFPPSLLSPGEETPTTPNRWNTIKDILDRSKT